MWIDHNVDACRATGAVLLSVPCLGHLHIANVIEDDSLQFHGNGEDVRYVCIVNNPKLGAFLQGDDQKIRPIARGTDGSAVVTAPLSRYVL